jgi:2-keto-4-pentenoate hydratase/2-oxohepta-3-ene-1,7-dioic acid hydratase in catechol pathway
MQFRDRVCGSTERDALPDGQRVAGEGINAMKYLRVGPQDAEKPALLDPDGVLRDLSGVIRDFDHETLSPAGMEKLAKVDWRSLPKVEGNPRIGPCVPLPRNFFAIGANFRDHIAERGEQIPSHPFVFMKASGAYCGPYDDTIIPRGSTQTDWEAELALVIGTKASYVSEDKALDHVAGYFICNDYSERAFQGNFGGTMMKGKGADSFGPIGPWLVTPDEVPDPQNLNIWLEVDGVRHQNGNTRDMIYNLKTLISHVSQFMTMYPGDILSTGTPAGVAAGMKPPKWLEAGQTVRLGVEGLGEQLHKVVQG